MPEPISFQELIRRVRGGDQAAAAEVVQRYEPAIRRAVHFRLARAGLGAILDSTDIAQTVFGSFFVRAALGQYEIDEPGQLLRLLVSMARHKLANQGRNERAECRDHRRVTPGAAAEQAAPAPGPYQQAATRELVREAYRRLSPEERQLVEMRDQGRDWDSIATQLGGSAAVHRKRLSRALNRVAGQLGLDGGHDE
jgi:RNA polymerase sigma-70 factor (ECF subfamily)